MKGVVYSLDKTQHRIASNLQINNCCRHFLPSGPVVSCWSIRFSLIQNVSSCDIFVISLRTSFWKCCDVCCPTLFPLRRKSAGL